MRYVASGRVRPETATQWCPTPMRRERGLGLALLDERKSWLPIPVCVCVGVIASDDAGQVSALMTAIDGLSADRDVIPETGTPAWRATSANGRRVLFPVGSGREPVEGAIQVLVGFNEDVPANVRAAMGRSSVTHRYLCFSPPLTRPQIETRLALELGAELSCSWFWRVRPGDDLTVTSPDDLLSQFVNVGG